MHKILVIEDDPLVMDNVIDILELEDYDVLSAVNGLEGVQRALEHAPDVILCDVMMPLMNGYEVLRALRADEQTATTPFIFLTAKADRSDQRHGMELGANDYLTKPFTPRELLQAVTTRLQQQTAVAQKYQAQIQDISQKAQQQLYQDAITGLPNRLTLGDRFADAVTDYRQEPESNRLLCLASLRIDRFSSLQHDLGYGTTDQLLHAFAQRLKTRFSGHSIAQISDAEFVIIFKPLAHKKEVTTAIQAFQADLNRPFLIAQQRIFLAISAGLTLYPRDGRALRELLQHAQTAIAQVEKQGGNGCEFYSAILSVGKAPRLYLEAELREAIAQQQLHVQYQPKINLKTQKIESCEALVRWHHPKQGLVSPGRFLPLAEEVGLIDSIGEYVLAVAGQQMRQWQQEFGQPLQVAVNVSSRQFNRVDLRQRVLQILVESGLAPECLELELTESTLVSDFTVAKRRLEAFRHLGIKIAIDDFGTGYSSLQYLQQFEFDTLKIDRCFVQNIHQNKGNAAITQATIEMAHRLGLTVVAEGVENQAELEWLQTHHCDFMQGYYFSPPVNGSEFATLLTSSAMAPLKR
ncbi:MAG: EAL domain-containing protein [Spirulina sp. SIO3F2]|nr:EAL domain-containing protein [Spirulina sp. SIO3F2]